MDNKFKKICMLLFTCATIFGFSYNSGVVAKADSNLQSVTTGAAVQVTTGQAVSITTPSAATYTLKNPIKSNFTGYWIAKEDNKYHLWNNGVLARNEFIPHQYSTRNEMFYADENGFPYTYNIHESEFKYISLVEHNGESYFIDGVGFVTYGWITVVRKNPIDVEMYCSDSDGKLYKNCLVDGLPVDENGKLLDKYMLEKYRNTDSGDMAKTVEPLK